MIQIQKQYSRLRCSYICRNLSIGNCPSFVSLGLFQFQSQMKAILIFCRQSGIAAEATLCCKQGSFQSSAILRSVLPVLFGARTLVQFLQFVIVVALQLHSFSLAISPDPPLLPFYVFVAGWLAKVATVCVGVNATNLRNLTLSRRPIQWRQQRQLHTGNITT